MNLDLSKINESNFEFNALAVFQRQYDKNLIYREFCNSIKVNSNQIDNLNEIPFLPISFFKSHQVVSGNSLPTEYFESSGTTNMQSHSRHYIADYTIYNESIELGFRHFFGKDEYVIIGLLPHYLERSNSSLVYMARHLMSSMQQHDEFYLYQFDEVLNAIQRYHSQNRKIILLGISFALLDFGDYLTEMSISDLPPLTIIETGGMKGSRPELPKQELFQLLKNTIPNSKIISEYGMCELFSQSYSDENLNFSCPPWMKVFVSDINDPLSTKKSGTGVAKIIDLANLHSCSFIETQDLIALQDSGQFQIQGRIDHSDIRGCSLMYN